MRLKNILLVFLAFISLTMFTGCIDIVEEIFLKKDGSGKYTMRMDMSGMIDMIAMMGAMEQGEGEEGGEENPLAAMGEEMDTTIYLRDADPETKKQFADNPGFLDKVNIQTLMSKEEGSFFMDFNLDFKNMDDVEYFYNNFDKVMAAMGDDEEGAGGMGGMLGGIGGGSGELLGGGTQRPYDYNAKKCTLIRHDTQEEDVASMEEDMNEEDKQMMEMMFGNASYKTIYHLPGKVKTMSNSAATLSSDKKTVTIEGNLMDYMEGKLRLDNTIKFK